MHEILKLSDKVEAKFASSVICELPPNQTDFGPAVLTILVSTDEEIRRGLTLQHFTLAVKEYISSIC